MTAPIRLLKGSAHDELFKNIAANLARYREGDFNYLVSDPSYFIEMKILVDWDEIVNVRAELGSPRDLECCIALYSVLGTIAPYLARDQRLWVYLTHTILLEYSRVRWPIPSDDVLAVPYIANHYFAIGARGVERGNAASRLWWMAFLCSRVDKLALEDALTTFLYRSDVRASIIERPTTSQGAQMFSALVKKLHTSYAGDKKLFARSVFRPLMKELNLQGGVRLLEALDESSIGEVIDAALVKILSNDLPHK